MSNQAARGRSVNVVPSTRPAAGRGRCRTVEGLEPRFLLFAVPVHVELTTDALPFLNAQTVAAISAEHALVDTAGGVGPANPIDSRPLVGGGPNNNTQVAAAPT